MKQEGSVTVFLTLIFLILFSLVGACLDSARFFGSRGYIETAAWGAQMAAFGDYNQELYQEYKLLAYGGYSGIGSDDWLQEYEEILMDNLKTSPKKKQGWQGLFQKRYASVYQVKTISTTLSGVSYLSQEQEFLGQIDTWLKSKAFTDITSSLLGKVTGAQKEEPQEILEELKEKENPEIEEESTEDGVEDTDETPDGAEKEEQDSVENPITFFQKLMTHGVLRLVCQEEMLSENTIEKREKNHLKEGASQEPEWCQKENGVAMLEGMLSQSDSLWSEEMNYGLEEKGKLLLYASQMFRNYLEEGEKSAAYGLEYLVSGKTKEDDTMAYIVNRLFLMRTILNYAYVNQNPLFLEKSLVTATEIAVPICAEPFIPLIQQCILLILAVEEACVDVTALLQGRLVPFTKTVTNFKMKYEEICLATESLFQTKAKVYPKSDTGQQLKGIHQGFGYLHYLWLMLLMTSWEKLYSRTLDLIQDDLRNRFNESFEIEKCICRMKVDIIYGIPLLSPVFIEAQKERNIKKSNSQQGLVYQSITMQYGYQ